MAKTTRRSVALAALTGLAMIGAACSSSASKSDGGTHKYVIGWSDPQAKQPIFTAFTDALDAAAKRAGIDVVTLDAQANPSKQVSDIQTLITKKVNAIIVFPNQANVLTPALDQAKAAGIKILGIDAAIPANGQTPTVPAPYNADLDQGFELTGAREAADYVAQQIGGSGNVVGIKIPVPVPSLGALLASYQAYVSAGHPGIHWLETLPDQTDDLAGAASSMADAITRYQGKINAVMSYTDIAGIGARKALDDAGIKNTVIVGQQGSQTGIDAVKAGTLNGDIDDQPWMEAIIALAMVRDLLGGQSVPTFVEAPVKFITKANVDTYVPWDTGVADIANGKTSLDVDLASLSSSGS